MPGRQTHRDPTTPAGPGGGEGGEPGGAPRLPVQGRRHGLPVPPGDEVGEVLHPLVLHYIISVPSPGLHEVVDQSLLYKYPTLTLGVLAFLSPHLCYILLLPPGAETGGTPGHQATTSLPPHILSTLPSLHHLQLTPTTTGEGGLLDNWTLASSPPSTTPPIPPQAEDGPPGAGEEGLGDVCHQPVSRTSTGSGLAGYREACISALLAHVGKVSRACSAVIGHGISEY